MQVRQPRPDFPGNAGARHLEAVLDEAIEQTFPASDPIAVILDTVPQPGPVANIRVKRAYEPAGDDGMRVLVDRLWPRGLNKTQARVDLWLKDIAPSAELRNWFAHDPEKWEEFSRRYREELRHNEAALAPLRELLRKERVTLLFGARDEQRNNAVVLKKYLEGWDRH